jgi:hypothetical protein
MSRSDVAMSESARSASTSCLLPTAYRSGHSSCMKLLATVSLWFLAVWVAYDMAAFALELPRQITPLIALAGALVVSRALTSERSSVATMSRLAQIGDASLRKA